MSGPEEEQPTADPFGDVVNTHPSSLNDMFASLLGEIKHLSSGIAALHEARARTDEVEPDDGQAEAEAEDDAETWLDAERTGCPKNR